MYIDSNSPSSLPTSSTPLVPSAEVTRLLTQIEQSQVNEEPAEVRRERARHQALRVLPASTAKEPVRSTLHTRVGPVPLEGYNYDKLHNPAHTTVKYLFGRVASHFPLHSVRSKDDAEKLLREMLPHLQSAGLEIYAVKSDCIVVKTEAGYEKVDVIRAAGGSNPGWQWLPVSSQSMPPGAPLPGTISAPAPQPAPDAGLHTRVGPTPLEGYNYDKLHNPAHTTVKYLFGRVASHFPLSGVKSKEDADKLLNEMLPHLQAAGLEIYGVKQDCIIVKTEAGFETVDVIRAAGGSNPGWQWLPVSASPTAPGPMLPPVSTRPPPAPPAPTVPGPTVPPPAPTPGTPPPAPSLPALSTVPQLPVYATVPIDRSSMEAAILSTARWVRDNKPEFFDKGDDRAVAFAMMTFVIGVLRANGFDAHRVVNHQSHPVGHPPRYGSDALVLGGNIYDIYGGWGDPGKSTPQLLNHGAYGSRPRE